MLSFPARLLLHTSDLFTFCTVGLSRGHSLLARTEATSWSQLNPVPALRSLAFSLTCNQCGSANASWPRAIYLTYTHQDAAHPHKDSYIHKAPGRLCIREHTFLSSSFILFLFHSSHLFTTVFPHACTDAHACSKAIRCRDCPICTQALTHTHTRTCLKAISGHDPPGTRDGQNALEI